MYYCYWGLFEIAPLPMPFMSLSEFDMIPQELYTASGEMVSMYKSKQEGPAVNAGTFCTDCFNKDLTTLDTGRWRIHDSSSLILIGRLDKQS